MLPVRGSDTPLARTAIPGKRFPDKPVYVLTSRRSASAAEDLAYNLKHMKRATIVGEKSKGAANPVSDFALNENFLISLPTGRPICTFTEDNWERKGVEPHVLVPQEKALEEAHKLALENLIKSEKDPEIKRKLEFEYEYIDTKYNAIKVETSILEKYQGSYGSSKIVLEGINLFYEISNIRFPMISKDKKVFFINESLKLTFEEDEILLQSRRRESTSRIPKNK